MVYVGRCSFPRLRPGVVPMPVDSHVLNRVPDGYGWLRLLVVVPTLRICCNIC